MSLILEIADKNMTYHLQLTAKAQQIGRSAKAAVQLEDTMVSGNHMSAHIASSGRVVIRDLGSTNGTYMNGNLIQETYLHIDDIIHIGQVKISLLKSEMSPKEKKLHTRNFEKTNITFVGLHEKTETKTKIAKAIEATRTKRQNQIPK